MKTPIIKFLLLFIAVLITPLLRADELNDRVQTRLDEWTSQGKQWVTDPAIIKAVSDQNAQPPATYATMTQEKWKDLGEMDPFVYSFTKNAAAVELKAKKTAAISEAFISDAHGLKVAFLTKPTNWSHQGKPKHDVPMTGKIWKGAIELDQSSGARQIQIAVPILLEEKPIGSLVIGVILTDLTAK